MEDILFDEDLLFETETPVAINEIESYSFDGPNFDYSATGGNYVPILLTVPMSIKYLNKIVYIQVV